MKKLKLLIVFGILFNAGFAQQANQFQRGQRGYVPPIQVNQGTFIQHIEPYDEVKKIMPKCIAVLGLDAFEQEIIKGMLIKKFESQNAILEDENSLATDKKKKIDELEKAYIKELGTILKPDEIIKYQAIDFTETNKEKKKRRKKKDN